jgi:hypothetical protein
VEVGHGEGDEPGDALWDGVAEPDAVADAVPLGRLVGVWLGDALAVGDVVCIWFCAPSTPGAIGKRLRVGVGEGDDVGRAVEEALGEALELAVGDELAVELARAEGEALPLVEGERLGDAELEGDALLGQDCGCRAAPELGTLISITPDANRTAMAKLTRAVRSVLNVITPRLLRSRTSRRLSVSLSHSAAA